MAEQTAIQLAYKDKTYGFDVEIREVHRHGHVAALAKEKRAHYVEDKDVLSEVA